MRFLDLIIGNHFKTTLYQCILFDLVPQCKHLLAVHLAEALGEFNSKTISDEDFAAYMSFDNTTNDKSSQDPGASALPRN